MGAPRNFIIRPAELMEIASDSQLLFAYGTLMDPTIQEKVLGRVVVSVADQLSGYAMGKITIGDSEFRIIRPQVGDIIDGMVLSVTDADLEQMDIYETAAYQRQKVILKSGKKTWAYVEPLGTLR